MRKSRIFRTTSTNNLFILKKSLFKLSSLNIYDFIFQLTWLLKYPIGNADLIQTCSCIFHLNSGAICKTAMGIIARSDAFIKIEKEHRVTVLDGLICNLINWNFQFTKKLPKTKSKVAISWLWLGRIFF